MSSSRRGLLFVVSAPSGTGKTTVVERLVQVVPDLALSRSYTSRAMRAGEADGVDYNFITRPRFEAMIAEDAFLEWADVFGNLYGTCRDDAEQELAGGRDLVLVIDVQGARQVRSRGAQTIGVFVLPPSFDALEQRLRGRSKDSEEAIRKRLATARREVRAVAEYEYVIVNDQLESCVDRLRAIVLAERSRSRVMAPAVAQIAASFAVSGKDPE
ncbi:MAG TPA: guanylate kinase [Vicinamibacterales bacterium]|nr:guanylate kinase [Vicinamibacterales bacterium]